MSLKVLEQLIEHHTNHEIVWCAVDGQQAVDFCKKEVPDIILMDLIMPVMNGVQATKEIMQKTPTAILIVTSSIQSNLDKVFEAMGYGALDVVKTPSFGVGGGEDTTEELLRKIEVISDYIGCEYRNTTTEYTKSLARKDLNQEIIPPILAIGASTGGPKAIATLLSKLPKNISFAIVIVQHINSDFVLSFARWLQKQTALPVHIAGQEQSLISGHVYVAGQGKHLIFNKANQLDYSVEPRELHYQPSIDVFFSHLSKISSSKFIAILLTGMGEDGALGLKLLHEHGWHTIAESAESCVVFGMPKAALDIDAVSEVLTIDEIPKVILNKMEGEINRFSTR